MKRKGLYVLATVALLALAAGCGSDEVKNTDNQVTEAVLPTEEPETPEATATPEPTATPAPTATPKPANYMEANGIEVLGMGQYNCKGIVIKEWDGNGEKITGLADVEYSFEVTETENGNGTKTICGTLNMVPYVNEGGGWSVWSMGGFVDLQTGKSYVPMVSKVAQVTLLKQDEKEYELQLAVEYVYPSVTYPYYTEQYTLVCPSEYEDAGFYITGVDISRDTEAASEREGLWKKLNFIRHGESDLLVFGVKKGLTTEPVKKPIKGTELAAENYFETKGFSTKGEGTYTLLGTEATRRRNAETGFWETVSLEEKEITGTFSVTEESLGDGRKMIQGIFTEILEMVSEDEVKIPYTKLGIVDKITGLVYRSRRAGLAEAHVLQKDGKEVSILISSNVTEEETGDGTIKSTITRTLICPEDCNDMVFYLTCDNEIDEDDDTFSNESEVFSLDEVEHGEYEMLFFR